MYLRFTRRRKNGKEHRYWSIVESKRCAGGRVVQRPVLYLGEINDSQREAWCRVVDALDEGSQQHRQLALFPAGQGVPEHARAPAAMGSLLAGVSSLRATGARSVLDRALAGLARGNQLAAYPADVGVLPVDRPGQRVAAASAMVRAERDG